MGMMEEKDEEEKMYEEMFAYRYTCEDPDYIEALARPAPHVPCVTGYFTRNRYNDRNRGGRGGRGNWDNRGQGHWQNRDGGYRQGEGRYNQGRDRYNEGHQRHSYGHEGGGYNRHYGGQRYNPY